MAPDRPAILKPHAGVDIEPRHRTGDWEALRIGLASHSRQSIVEIIARMAISDDFTNRTIRHPPMK